MKRPARLLIIPLLALATSGPSGAEHRTDIAAQGRRAQAYHLYSLAQQAMLGRDFAMAAEFLERAAERDPSPGLLLELAELRYALNDLDRAGDLARRIAATRPDHPGLHRLLGDVHETQAREGIEPEENTRRAVAAYLEALRIDPEDREACEELAQIYYGQGRLQEARDLLVSFSRAVPLTPPMSLLFGKILARTGQLSEAEEILAPIVARYPANLEAADTLARLFEHQDRRDEAIDVYRMVRGTSAPTAYLQRQLGSLHLQKGQYLDAIRELELGQRIEPRDHRGLLLLAQAYEGAGRFDDALRAFDGVVGMDGNDLEARFRRAHLLHREGEIEEARTALQEIIGGAPPPDEMDERGAAILSLALSQMGLIDLEERDYAAAAAAFSRALEVSPDPGAELYLLLGRSTLEDGRPDAAQRVLQEASRRHPSNLDLQVLEGELLLALGNVARAREFYASLLQDHGGSPGAYVKISEALLRRERFEDAEVFLQEGTGLHPEDDALYFARGAANERMGRIEAAERYLSRSIRLNPKNAMALNYLGYMLAERGMKLKDSIRYVERALAIEPRNPAYLDSLGWAQFKLAMYEAAERNLRTAARYDRGDPTIREHLGDLYAATGRPQEAIREWQEALSRAPDNPERIRGKIQKVLAGLDSGKR